MPKMRFFLNKRMKEIFSYVLDFMLTFDKKENTLCPLKLYSGPSLLLYVYSFMGNFRVKETDYIHH